FDMKLVSNPDVSNNLMNYFSIKNDEDYQKCLKLYKFFSKGTLAKKTSTQHIYSGFNETIKSNISILSKRQIIP
ncbi:MAG: hypothetical protein N2749_07415, partial [Clostridia bacterium]|nr:hypothetical protein [Clostridia bacterium]